MNEFEQLPIPSFKELRTWLAQQDPNSVVGISCNACNCPVHKYLVTHGWPEEANKKTVVGIEEIEVIAAKRNILYSTEMPMWMFRFIDKVDSLGGAGVTPSQAFVLLGQCVSKNEVTA